MATAIIGSSLNRTSGSFKTITVDTLPDKGKSGYMYLILSDNPSENNIYDEYIWIDNNEGSGVWEKIGFNSESLNIDLLAYGVEWKPEVSDPALTRIGNLTYHKTLPIQSLMKGCIYNPKEKRVVYWLDEDDWKYKKGGNPTKGEPENLSRLDGYDGEVMVYVPEFWIRSWDEPDIRRVMISRHKIDETWEHQPELFISAGKDTILRIVPENMGYLSTLEPNTCVSIFNNEIYCRGGNNSSTHDNDTDIFRSNLGKPATRVSRGTMRTYARKNGKELLSYRQYKNILYWLYVIEYANFNCQESYNPELTSDGFHQGGLGLGISNMKSWAEYNNYFPICLNGYLSDLGNNTGVKDIVIPTFTYTKNDIETTVNSQTLKAIKWRGIENPFGDIWTNVDGIIIDADADNHPNNMNYVYTTDDPSKYGDSVSDISNMDMSGLEIHLDGYITEFDLGHTAEIIPRKVGGGPTINKSDYHYTGSKGKSIRTLMLSGCATYGAYGGLGCFYSATGVAYSTAHIGFRSVCVI